MPKRDWHLRIVDMQEAAEKIQSYVAGMTAEQFRADNKTIDAVLRNIEIIGEAAVHIPKSARDRHAEIRWADIRGMRNIVVHGYFRVDLGILWNVTQADVPLLLRQLMALRTAESF